MGTFAASTPPDSASRGIALVDAARLDDALVGAARLGIALVDAARLDGALVGTARLGIALVGV